MTETVLTGLDGANPLGFLAALGALQVLTEHGGNNSTPRLAWRDEGRWRPVLTPACPRAALLDALAADLAGWREAPELALAYDDNGKLTRDLKPPPESYRELMSEALRFAAAGRRRPAEYAVAFATEVATDNGGKTKPTAFHFTAGQQKFLDMANALAAGVQRHDLEEAVFGPWKYDSPLPVLRWDVGGDRSHALLGFDPSKEKPLGVPGADWLALRGLALFPAAPKASRSGRARILTTGFMGRGKSYRFTWPLWTAAITIDAARTIVRYPRLRDLSAHERRALGVGAVLESRVIRTEQGGYGSFGPPRVLPARSESGRWAPGRPGGAERQ